MRKILSVLLLQILLFLFYSPSFSQKALADNNCNVEPYPKPVTANMKFIDLYISNKKPYLNPGKTYRVKINDTIVTNTIRPDDLPLGLGWILSASTVGAGKWIFDNNAPAKKYVFQKGSSQKEELAVKTVNPRGISINGMSDWGFFKDLLEQMPVLNTRFEFGKNYKVSVLEENADVELCSDTFLPEPDCIITYKNKKWDQSEPVEFSITDQSKIMNPDLHHVILKMTDKTIWDKTYSMKDLTKGIDLSNDYGKFDIFNEYRIEVRDSSRASWGIWEDKACDNKFSICATGDLTCQPPSTASGSFSWGAQQGAAGKNEVCKESKVEGKKNFTCSTAIGDIETDPTRFIKRIFGVLLGISGGIALILIIVSGYHLMMAQGNPEKIQGAKETLTAAIVGLLFIIFSFVILEVIGVDLLKIPGLGK